MQGLKGKLQQHSKAIGLGMAAMGGAVLAAGALSIKTFADMGDEVAKMAKRTGFSTEALSELRHAAELSGASLAGIEKASRTLSGAITDASFGLETYVRAFDQIGLSYEDLAKLTPEEQFLKVMEALAGVEDETVRAAIAADLMGRSGTAMLPILADGTKGLAKMRQEAHDLGIVFDKEASIKAEKMTDAMLRVKQATSGLKMEIADKLIPVLMPLLQKITATIKGIVSWAKEHPRLTKVIVLGASAFGALLIVLGMLLMLMPGITAAMTAFGISVNIAIWPITLVAAAIAALIALGFLLIKNWSEVAKFFKDSWNSIARIFRRGVEETTQQMKKLADDSVKELRRMAGERKRIADEELEIEREWTERQKQYSDDRLQTELDNLKEREQEAKDLHQDTIDRLDEEYGLVKEQALSRAEIAKDSTQGQKDALDEQLDAQRTYHDYIMDWLDEEYRKKLETLDLETGATITGIQEQIDAIDAQTEQEAGILKEQRREERLAELKAAVDVTKTVTEKEEDILKKQRQVKRSAELKAAVDSAKTDEERGRATERLEEYKTQLAREQLLESRKLDEERTKAIERLEEYETRLARERLVESRKLDKETLREQIKTVKATAKTEAERLQEELTADKEHQKELFTAKETRLTDEKTALDTALTVELGRLKEELTEKQRIETDKLAATVKRITDAEIELKREHETAMTRLGERLGKYKEIARAAAAAVPTSPPTPSTAGITGFQHGGIIKEPTLLTSLRSMRPYAVAGEAGREHIVPESGMAGGYQTANIIVQLDGRTIARVIGQPLIDQIRIRTGAKI